jgi:hypothetical protein
MVSKFFDYFHSNNLKKLPKISVSPALFINSPKCSLLNFIFGMNFNLKLIKFNIIIFLEKYFT